MRNKEIREAGGEMWVIMVFCGVCVGGGGGTRASGGGAQEPRGCIASPAGERVGGRGVHQADAGMMLPGPPLRPTCRSYCPDPGLGAALDQKRARPFPVPPCHAWHLTSTCSCSPPSD